ncbi:MAG: ABC transporter substrate-binding protein, partial [Solirubrobacteraceae bacterium]
MRRTRNRRFPVAVALALATALALAVAGCGGSSGPRLRSVTLVLDFTPNPVHVGIYTALARHYDHDAGIALHVIAPSASTDAIRLLETGSVDFAILDIHDLAIARERGESIVGILPIVERPLAAVIAAPSIRSPRMLDGRTVGITGDPSDTAVLDSIVAGAGGNPRSLHTITIGY